MSAITYIGNIFYCGIMLLLVLNGFQRIGFYEDWVNGFQSLGIGMIMIHLLGRYLERH